MAPLAPLAPCTALSPALETPRRSTGTLVTLHGTVPCAGDTWVQHLAPPSPCTALSPALGTLGDTCQPTQHGPRTENAQPRHRPLRWGHPGAALGTTVTLHGTVPCTRETQAQHLALSPGDSWAPMLPSTAWSLHWEHTGVPVTSHGTVPCAGDTQVQCDTSTAGPPRTRDACARCSSGPAPGTAPAHTTARHSRTPAQLAKASSLLRPPPPPSMPPLSSPCLSPVPPGQLAARGGCPVWHVPGSRSPAWPRSRLPQGLQRGAVPGAVVPGWSH